MKEEIDLNLELYDFIRILNMKMPCGGKENL